MKGAFGPATGDAVAGAEAAVAGVGVSTMPAAL